MKELTKTTPAEKDLSAAISADIMVSLPRVVSSMFLNNKTFDSDRIAMLSHLLSHINPLSSKNLRLAISDLTRLKMGLGETSIDYMSCVCGISQRLRGLLMEKIIPLFANRDPVSRPLPRRQEPVPSG